MPKLNEYLGGLVSEIASARKMADLQTVQIAREYAKDDMLKHFSIPRMKVSSVDLTVPFAQAGASAKMSFKEFIYDEITTIAKADYDPLDESNNTILKNYLSSLEPEYNKIITTIKAYEIRLIDTASYQLDTQIQRSIVADDHPLIKEGTFDALSKQIFTFCLNNFNWMKTTDENLFTQSIRNRMIIEYENSIKNLPNQTSEIIVEASQLMKIDPKYLIYAKMTITESGMEWSKYENINGDIVETLIPE